MSKVKVNIEDLSKLQNWISNYSLGLEDDVDYQESLEWSERMYAWVEAEIDRRIRMSEIAEVKREYAKEHGVPVRSLRIKKTA